MMHALEAIAVRLLPCPYCASAPGDRCVAMSTTGALSIARYTHVGRLEAVYAAWRLGFSEAWRDALTLAEAADRRHETIADLIETLRPFTL